MLIQIVAVLTAYYLGRSGMDLNEVLAIPGRPYLLYFSRQKQIV